MNKLKLALYTITGIGCGILMVAIKVEQDRIERERREQMRKDFVEGAASIISAIKERRENRK